LRADQQRLHAPDQEKDQREQTIHDADALVVDGREPAD